jgi:copper chaperone CopZ
MKYLIAAILLFASRLHAAEPAPHSVTNQFRISDMYCEGCAGGITSELKRTAGVVYVNVSLTNKLAIVAYDTNRLTSSNIVQVVKDAGYTAAPVVKR